MKKILFPKLTVYYLNFIDVFQVSQLRKIVSGAKDFGFVFTSFQTVYLKKCLGKFHASKLLNTFVIF